MTRLVRILDAKSLEELGGPLNEEAERTRRYVLGLMERGAGAYIDNAQVEMLAVAVDDVLLPMVVSNGTSGNSNACCPSSHYVDYAGEELSGLRDRTLGRTMKGLLKALGVSLRALGLDRVVYVNNFLWTTNPWPRRLGPESMRAVIRHVARAYPGHAVVCRSVNRVANERLYRVLQKIGCGLVVSHVVYLLDGRSKKCMEHANLRRDLQLLGRGDYEEVAGREFTEEDIQRMEGLYWGLYIDKYCALNLQLREDFFRLLLEEGTMQFTGLKNKGVLRGFAGCQVQGEEMVACCLGYDTSMPRKAGLYRRLMAIQVRHALEKKLLMNLGAGAGRFKALRGGVPVVGYDAVYHAHLPIHRRLPWWVLQSIFTETLVRKFEL